MWTRKIWTAVAASLAIALTLAPIPAAAQGPVMRSAAYEYDTEWVWLLSIYQDQLRDLAKAVSDKYRKSLKIPDGMAVTPDQWRNASSAIRFSGVKDDFGMEYEKEVTIEATECLGAARAEFGSRKQRLDDSLATAFARWSDAVGRGDAGSVAALLSAQSDLQLFSERIKGGWLDRWLRYLQEKGLGDLVSEEAKRTVDATVDRLASGWPKIGTSGTTALVSSKLIKLAEDKGASALGDAVKADLKSLMMEPAPELTKDLASQLGLTAEKMLLDAAYLKQGGPIMSAPGANAAYNPQYYALNGEIARSAGYNTSAVEVDLHRQWPLIQCQAQPDRLFRLRTRGARRHYIRCKGGRWEI
jgi:hypothetical protein